MGLPFVTNCDQYQTHLASNTGSTPILLAPASVASKLAAHRSGPLPVVSAVGADAPLALAKAAAAKPSFQSVCKET